MHSFENEFNALLKQLADDWWLIVIRSGIAIALGLAAFLWPSITLYILVALLAVYLLLDGAALLAVGWRHGSSIERWWLVFIQGLAGLIAGVLIVVFPDAGALALLILVAFWALVTGALEIAAALHLRRLIEGSWLLLAGGVLSCLFGILLVLFPGPGLVAYVWLVGLFSLFYGVAMGLLAYQLRRYR